MMTSKQNYGLFIGCATISIRTRISSSLHQVYPAIDQTYCPGTTKDDFLVKEI
jgi:hypothetical protein